MLRSPEGQKAADGLFLLCAAPCSPDLRWEKSLHLLPNPDDEKHSSLPSATNNFAMKKYKKIQKLSECGLVRSVILSSRPQFESFPLRWPNLTNQVSVVYNIDRQGNMQKRPKEEVKKICFYDSEAPTKLIRPLLTDSSSPKISRFQGCDNSM